jgi:hypothetical protein
MSEQENLICRKTGSSMQYNQSCFEQDIKKNQYDNQAYYGGYLDDDSILNDNTVIDYILALEKDDNTKTPVTWG